MFPASFGYSGKAGRVPITVTARPRLHFLPPTFPSLPFHLYLWLLFTSLFHFFSISPVHFYQPFADSLSDGSVCPRVGKGDGDGFCSGVRVSPGWPWPGCILKPSVAIEFYMLLIDVVMQWNSIYSAPVNSNSYWFSRLPLPLPHSLSTLWRGIDAQAHLDSEWGRGGESAYGSFRWSLSGIFLGKLNTLTRSYAAYA